MRVGRTAVAGLIAGGLALSLVAAEAAPATDAVGSASTRLLGARAQVTGPVSAPAARLLDVLTEATTDGTPFAQTSIVPFAVGDDEVAATGASSDGDNESSTPGGSYGSAGGPLGLNVSPIQTTATASAEQALATVGTATGELSALLGALGLDLNTAGITSLVDQDKASATQGLQVSGLSLSLADLGLDADLLGQLGLGDVLALLDQLPVDVPSDLADVSGILGDIGDLEDAVGALDASDLLATLDELQAVNAALPQVQELTALLTALESLDAGALLTGLTDLAGDLDAAGCEVDLGNLTDLTGELEGAIACVEGELDAIATDFGVAGGGDLLGALQDLQATLEGLVPDQLADLVAQLDVITGLLEQILASLGDLDELLALLPDLLADAAGTELLDVGAFDVGTTAIAGDSLDTSSATVLCDAVDVSVLGESFTTPACSDALSELAGVSDLVNGAFGEVAGILNALPLQDVVQVGELRAELFTDLVEEVTEADGVITSTAGFNLLELEIPSITIDAAQVTDTVGSLGLPDLGAVDTVLGQVDGVASTLEGLGLTDQLAALAAADPTGTMGEVTTLIDGLEVGDLGSLTDDVGTPGLELLIDPVSTADFAAAVSGGTADPAPAPAPAPVEDDEPTLPTTGGGMALLGVLAMAGAAGLRRRR